jgi:hypothetical protein
MPVLPDVKQTFLKRLTVLDRRRVKSGAANHTYALCPFRTSNPKWRRLSRRKASRPVTQPRRRFAYEKGAFSAFRCNGVTPNAS